MSLTFPSTSLKKPSGLKAIPNLLSRPALGELYGFDSVVSDTQQIFNVTTRNTNTAILASTPSNPSGEVNIAFSTDINDFYIYDGSDWVVYNSE